MINTIEPSKAQKYPRQIWAAVRKQESLVCDQNLYSPSESNEDTPYLTMHNGFSVFNVNYVSRGYQILTNLPAADVPLLLERYHFQASVLFQEQTKRYSLPQSPAYRVQIRGIRGMESKSAAEILMLPNGKEILTEARNNLYQNLSKYRKNAAMIEAIDDAIGLDNRGMLQRVKGSISLPPLYKKDFKYKKVKDGNGNNLVYHILIECLPGESLPWRFSLTNYFAPLRTSKGLTQPDTRQRTNEHKKQVYVTEEEMALLIYRIQRTMECFENNMFAKQWAFASKALHQYREKSL